VKAGKETALYNIKDGKSLLIHVGGHEEMLLCERGVMKLYLNKRKGFFDDLHFLGLIML